MPRNCFRSILLVSVLLGLSWPSMPHAGASEVPSFIQFQSRLTDASGQPLEGSHTLVFRICDAGPAAAEGESCEESGPLSVTASRGNVSAEIPVSSSVFAGIEAWIEVKVDGETLSPRSRLVSVPYAFRAEHAGAASSLEGRLGADQIEGTAVTESGDLHVLGDGPHYVLNGSLGIGTSVPDARLHVAGSVRIVDGTQGSGRVLTSDANGLAGWQPPSSGESIPSGAVMFFNLSACPSGWAELVASRGRYLLGLPAGGSLGATAGTALSNLEDRPVGQHGHSVNDPGHSHPLLIFFDADARQPGHVPGAVRPGGSQFTSNVPTVGAGTGVSINSAGPVPGTNAPYLQLLVCQKS